MKKLHPVIVFLVTIIFCSCEFPKLKPLDLKKDYLEIQDELKHPEEFETVGIQNNTNSNNRVTVYSMEITLVNGKNLPATADGLQQLAKTKAKIVADALTNKDEYASITVNLKTETKDGLINKSMERSFSFSIEELETETVPGSDSLQNDSIIINTTETE